MNDFEDITSVVQVIGCVFNNPSILDNADKYPINEEDFPEQFHRIVFGTMYNLHEAQTNLTIDSIVDYLSVRPKYEAIFKTKYGIEFITKASQLATFDTFNYYYSRLKKFTLLRAYNNCGLDVSEFYDANNILDTAKKQKQEEWLDNTSLHGIAELVETKIEEVRSTFVENEFREGYQASDGIDELLADLEKHPEVGAPLYGRLVNTVTRGARLRKLYLRSAGTGVGKSRALVADAANFACGEIYDTDFNMWIKNGAKLPTLFIATEQDRGEVQTMLLAFLSAVNEEHILNHKYLEGEEERIKKAVEILKEAPLWIEEMPDFSVQDIENCIKRHIRDHDVRYICFDYIHTSMKILEEVTRRSGGVKLREDNILFILSTRLKDICNQYGVFIITATQLNALAMDAEIPDQNLLRGAKIIADRVDVGEILLGVTDKDLVKLEPILAANPGFQIPNIKLSVYKNRRGSYKGVYLWCYADLGTCRIQPQFVTKYNGELVPIEDIKIIVDEPGAF